MTGRADDLELVGSACVLSVYSAKSTFQHYKKHICKSPSRSVVGRGCFHAGTPLFGGVEMYFNKGRLPSCQAETGGGLPLSASASKEATKPSV